MMIIGGGSSSSTAQLCLADPKPERLRTAFEPGKSVRVTLEGAVQELTLREGHADLSLDVKGVAVRPDGKRTISNLIEEKQRKAVR
jgi:hypothetical protein